MDTFKFVPMSVSQNAPGMAMIDYAGSLPCDARAGASVVEKPTIVTLGAEHCGFCKKHKAMISTTPENDTHVFEYKSCNDPENAEACAGLRAVPAHFVVGDDGQHQPIGLGFKNLGDLSKAADAVASSS